MADHPVPKSAHPGVYHSHDLSGIRPHLRDALAAGLEGWFPDISEFNGAVNWNALGAAHAAGTISGVAIRAGFGTVRADKQFAANQAGARAHGIPAIYYWFNYPTFNTPLAEAAKFNAVVGPLGPGEAMVGDFEDDPASNSIFPRGQAGVDWAKAFLTAIEAPQNASWWYTYPFLLSVIPFSQLDGVWPFWEADYSAILDSAFTVPIARQFTDCGSTPGVSGCCDQSRVLKAPLSQWLTPGALAPQGGVASMFHPTIAGRVDDVYLSAGGRVIHTISQIFQAPPAFEDWGIPPVPPTPSTKGGVVPGSVLYGWSPDGQHFLVRVTGTDGVLYYRQEGLLPHADGTPNVEQDWTPLTAANLPAAATSPAFLHTHDTTVSVPGQTVIAQSGPAKTSA